MEGKIQIKFLQCLQCHLIKRIKIYHNKLIINSFINTILFHQIHFKQHQYHQDQLFPKHKFNNSNNKQDRIKFRKMTQLLVFLNIQDNLIINQVKQLKLMNKIIKKQHHLSLQIKEVHYIIHNNHKIINNNNNLVYKKILKMNQNLLNHRLLPTNNNLNKNKHQFLNLEYLIYKIKPINKQYTNRNKKINQLPLLLIFKILVIQKKFFQAQQGHHLKKYKKHYHKKTSKLMILLQIFPRLPYRKRQMKKM